MKCLNIFILLLFFSCSNRIPKPNNLISKDKMVDVLYDVTILNAAKNVDKRRLENHGILPNEFIYSKYSIDSLQLRESLDYYASDLDEYKSIINKLEERFIKEKELLNPTVTKEVATKQKIKKPELVEDKSKSLLTDNDLSRLNNGLNIIRIGLNVEKPDDLDFNNNAVYKISRKSTGSAFVLINDIATKPGNLVSVSVFVKRADKKSTFGLRVSGVYPNRADAVFDLNNKKVIGTKSFGYFENQTATIKKIDNDWVECKMKVEANIDRVQIVFGPTDLSKQVELWEAGSDFISSVYSTIPTFTIK